MKGQYAFKAGTIVMFFFILIVGYVGYYLVSGNMGDYGSAASEQRELAMTCTDLEIEFVEVKENEGNVEVFFRSNRDLPGVEVGLTGANRTRLIEGVESEMIYSATFNTSDYSNIYLDSGLCKNAQWWQ